MITDKTECNNPLFGRILTAMVTPFTKNGDVDYELAIKLSNYLFENGSDGIVLCGTTGESPTLSWEEQHDLFIAVKGMNHLFQLQSNQMTCNTYYSYSSYR